MASTGFTLPGRGASINTGSNEWTDPGNVTADDATNASTLFGASSQSDSLFADLYGFSIPSGATDIFIEVKYERVLPDGGAPGPEVTSTDLQLAEGGSVLGTVDTDPSNWTGSVVAVTRGSDSDDWGAALTAEIVNSDTFGVRLEATWDGSLGTIETAAVDYIQINVHYTEAASFPHLPLLGAG
jgi:hypothetical protein